MKKILLFLFCSCFIYLNFSSANSTTPLNTSAEDYQELLDKIIVGKWTGVIGYFSRIDYELNLEKSGDQYVGTSKTGSATAKVKAYFDEAGNFIVTESKIRGGNRRKKACNKTLKLELLFRFDKKDLILKGRAKADACKLDHRMQVSKSNKGLLFQQHVEEALSFLQITDAPLTDQDTNGQIDYYEPACVSVNFNNPTPFEFDDVIFSAYGLIDGEQVLLSRYVAVIGQAKTSSKTASSTIWKNSATPTIEVTYQIGYLGKSFSIGTSELTLSQKKATNVTSITSFSDAELLGEWISKNKKVEIVFQEDGTFVYSINQQKAKSGKWAFFTTISCKDGEVMDKIHFYEVENHLDKGSFLADFTEAVYNVHTKSSKPGESLEIGMSSLDGGYVSHYFNRFQEVDPSEVAPTAEVTLDEGRYYTTSSCESCIYCSSGYGDKRTEAKKVVVYCDGQKAGTITITHVEECIGHEGRSTSYKNYYRVSGAFGSFRSDYAAMDYIWRNAVKLCVKK